MFENLNSGKSMPGIELTNHYCNQGESWAKVIHGSRQCKPLPVLANWAHFQGRWWLQNASSRVPVGETTKWSSKLSERRCRQASPLQRLQTVILVQAAICHDFFFCPGLYQVCSTSHVGGELSGQCVFVTTALLPEKSCTKALYCYVTWPWPCWKGRCTKPLTCF